jgi:hypothetical protein
MYCVRVRDFERKKINKIKLKASKEEEEENRRGKPKIRKNKFQHGHV